MTPYRARIAREGGVRKAETITPMQQQAGFPHTRDQNSGVCTTRRATEDTQHETFPWSFDAKSTKRAK